MKSGSGAAKACALSLIALCLPGCSLTSDEWAMMAAAVAVGVSAAGASSYDYDYYEPGLGYGQFGGDMACVTSLATGQSYRTNAQILSGSQLNAATDSYAFNPYATYFVSTFGIGQTTIIKLDFYTGSGLPLFPQEGTDQYGRRWAVQQDYTTCGIGGGY
jgi:hypothetical protein